MDLTLEPRATLTVYRIPGCPKCRTPNPQQLSHCAECGEPAPGITDMQTVDALVLEGGNG